MVCNECNNHCHSLEDCQQRQQFNIILEKHNDIMELKKYIKIAAPHYKGNNKWFSYEIKDQFEERIFDLNTEYRYRFLTVTFDPKKFTFNQLTNPPELINYGLNCFYELRYLFKNNPIIVIEYHKSGIPHFHINYDVEGPLEHATLLLRLRYYFSKDLRTKHSIHDRIFNDIGINYIKKSNSKYLTFKILIENLKNNLTKNSVN